MRCHAQWPHRPYLMLAVPFLVGTELRAAPVAQVAQPQRGAVRPADTKQRTTPSVLRLSIDSARLVLARAKLQLEVVRSVPSSAAPGTIVAQRPAAGDSVPLDNVVRVM